MKKLTILFLFTFITNFIHAQEFKPFKLGFGLGYTAPKGGGGILIAFEPAYRLKDEIAVGLKIESAAMAKEVGDNSADISSVGAYQLFGQYYLSNSSLRPYAGLGIGLFGLGSVKVGSNGAGADIDSKIGFSPRVGFDLGHFNINIEYNIIGKSDVTLIDLNGNSIQEEITNSYLGLRLGFFLFGGKIN